MAGGPNLSYGAATGDDARRIFEKPRHDVLVRDRSFTVIWSVGRAYRELKRCGSRANRRRRPSQSRALEGPTPTQRDDRATGLPSWAMHSSVAAPSGKSAAAARPSLPDDYRSASADAGSEDASSLSFNTRSRAGVYVVGIRS